MTKQEFLTKYYPSAVAATAGSGLFPETLITQLIGESGYNLSELATKYFNFFGIKADKSWKGRVVSKTTFEYYNGVKTPVAGNGKVYIDRDAAIRDGANAVSLFRVYSGVTEGFKGWVNFLKENPLYTRAGLFAATTPQAQFAALKAAGYATDPNYGNYLTNIYNGLLSTLDTVKKTVKDNAGTIGIVLLVASFFF
jgi:flagellum-specific peptidoglycan hydrolase FlgJ